MAIHILIDGYNLIRQFGPLSRVEAQDFSSGRRHLLEWLARYRRRNRQKITVVFDGVKGGGTAEERDLFQGIKIIFSRSGQTADEVIKQIVSREGERVLVVTSDLDLAAWIRSRRAGWIRSEEFAQKVQRRLSEGEEEPDEDLESIPSSKKKGASRRLPKKKRREMEYWKKI